ncbi:MAG: hypothetical protein IKL53_06675 [Lachnospiraceae bacterium]|nr:hypothetical protein [Lachnospiraceae bacterium]
MKATDGFIELVIVVAFFLAGIPLLTNLVVSISKTEYTYLDDKTTMEIEDISYDGYINIDFATAQLMTAVQDDFVPEEARDYVYLVYGEDTNEPSKFEVNVEDGWYVKRNTAMQQQLSTVNTNGIWSSHRGDIYVLEYDWYNNKWLVTNKFVMPYVVH